MRKLLIVLIVVVAFIVLASLQLASSIGNAMNNTGDEINSGASANMSIDGNVSWAAEELDPNDVVYCDVLRDRIMRSDCQRVQEFVAKLEVGTGAVEHPNTMVRGETAT